jgi:hypothetical protein
METNGGIMTRIEKIKRTEKILASTPAKAGKLIEARHRFPDFIVKSNGSVLYLYERRSQDIMENFAKVAEQKNPLD